MNWKRSNVCLWKILTEHVTFPKTLYGFLRRVTLEGGFGEQWSVSGRNISDLTDWLPNRTIIVLDNFCGVNAPTVVNFKLPTKHHHAQVWGRGIKSAWKGGKKFQEEDPGPRAWRRLPDVLMVSFLIWVLYTHVDLYIKISCINIYIDVDIYFIIKKYRRCIIRQDSLCLVQEWRILENWDTIPHSET